jgi:transposase
MDQLIERCAGLDVHKKAVVACVRVPGPQGNAVSRPAPSQTMTDGLLALRDWLCAHQVRVVGMESTGSYWKPVVRHEVPRIRAEVKGLRRRPVAAGR